MEPDAAGVDVEEDDYEREERLAIQAESQMPISPPVVERPVHKPALDPQGLLFPR